EGVDGGRVVCSVSCSPTAYPLLSSNALDDLQHDMTSLLHATLSHPTIRPKNLCILPGKKSWLLNLDVIIFSDAGNIFDAIFMAARAALWDTKLPTSHFLDATLQEEASVPLKLLVLYSFQSDAPPLLRSMRLLGTGVSDLVQVKSLLKDGEKYARIVWTALEGKLKDEDLRRNQKARERFLNR
ncbi:hypothetical protein AZE42_13199, partial [Rhizopogon vesiculosus]